MLPILGRAPDHDFDQPLGLLSDCHRRIEHFLDLLLRIARTANGQPLDPSSIQALQNAQRYFLVAAPKHTADEEVSLFPRMKAAAAAQGERCTAIDKLEDDHAHAALLHTKADALFDTWLNAGSLNETQTAELVAILDELRALYRAHIHIEDTEVFPLASTLLSEAELATVGQEMRTRRGLAAPR